MITYRLGANVYIVQDSVVFVPFVQVDHYHMFAYVYAYKAVNMSIGELSALHGDLRRNGYTMRQIQLTDKLTEILIIQEYPPLDFSKRPKVRFWDWENQKSQTDPLIGQRIAKNGEMWTDEERYFRTFL